MNNPDFSNWTKETLTIELLNFLYDWLFDRILRVDKNPATVAMRRYGRNSPLGLAM